MARMIAEERSELGTLASLGFKDGSMISTYLFYVLSATVLGAAAGFLIGCTFFPKIIYACFPYILPPLMIRYNTITFSLILVVAVALMTSVTVLFCHRELKQKPATLMRPVPPQNGQSILLERVGFIWKHLSFTWKITMRNLFRYKQRVLMTIVGIAGCTALLLTGFGVKDSINGVAQKQYGQIFKYNDLIVLKNETQTISGDLKSLLAKEQIQNPLLIRQSAVTCGSGGKSLDAYLVVPENEDTFTDYFSLKNTGNGTDLKLKDNGVIISQKLSEVYKVGKGDKITVKDTDNNSYALPVAGVTENNLQNYIYMSKGMYSKVFSKPASYNMIVSDNTGNEKNLAEHLIDSGLAVNVNFKDDILQQAMEGDKSLNDVVILLVCVAALLAVIVLYNLMSINISERKREIATLKVLGFTDRETNEYIYREAFVLTLISIGVGLILGTGVHRLVMEIIQQDTVEYFKIIKGLSYVWAFLITVGTSVVMQIITYFKLKQIDMIESLKSVE
jgi:putative ABC transport system permease protein